MMMAGCLRTVGSFLMSRAASSPSMPGIRQSMNTTSYGASPLRSLIAAMASAPELTASTRSVRLLRDSTRISRAAALSSTTSPRNAWNLAGTTRRPATASPTSSQTVNAKVLPTPGSLSSQICPPINSTRRRLIVRPRPVPPCFRVVDMSACENGWNNLADCSRVMPIPVSRTENFNCTLAPVRSSSSILRRISPRSVNFTALLTRLVRICAEPQRIAAQLLGNRPGHIGQELQALVVGLLRGERRRPSR